MSTQARQTSGLAIASLVLSILTVVIGPFGCIPGIICGHLAKREIRSRPDMEGDGLARAGLIVGYLFLILMLASALVLLLRVATM